MVSANGKEKVTDADGKGQRKQSGRGGGDDDNTGRKRKSPGVLQFVDHSAYQDDREEYSSSDDSGYETEMFEDEFGFGLEVNSDPGKASNLPHVKEEMSDEEYIRLLEEIYKSRGSFVPYAEDGYEQRNSIDSSVYVPSAKDPTIWKVKCMIGRERYSALCLMQKYADMAKLQNKLQIISACALDHLKGFIIIEAEKQNYIYEACKGLSSIYSSKVTAIPSSEISHLLSVRSKSSAILEGIWACVKNGKYKGDLAQMGSLRVDGEVGNSSKENYDDLNDTQMTDYKQLIYKLFQYQTYRLRGTNGDFGCPFCDDYKEEHGCRYTHLLLHATRVAEGEETGKQRANHFAMARYLAIDLVEEVKAEADQLSWISDDGERLKRPRLDGDNIKGELDLAHKVRQLEGELNEKTDELNDLITRECQINDELQEVRRELIKGLNDILKGSHVQIGIKNMGEIDSKVFINEMEKRLPLIDAQMKGVELCSLWQENFKNPLWHPYQIIVDHNGKPKRMLKDDDPSLQDLKKNWGQELHDAVVGALNDLHDYNPSGCYVVPELWNFKENRKAKLDEVISYILEAVKDVSKMGSTSEINNARIREHERGRSCCGKKRNINVSRINNSGEESDISDSEIYECKERIYELLKSCIYQVRGPRGELRCPFCSVEEDHEYNYLLRHAFVVAEGSSESAEQRAMHFALAKYLVIDLQDNAQPPHQCRIPSPATAIGEDASSSGEDVSSSGEDEEMSEGFPEEMSEEVLSRLFGL